MNEPSAIEMQGADTTAVSLRDADRAEQIERRVAAALVKMRPGRRGATALHEEIDLVLNAELLVTAEPQEGVTLVEIKSDRRARSNVLDEALKQNTQAHVDALSRAGLSAPVLELLQSWVEVTVDARVVQRQLELKRATSVHTEGRAQAPSLAVVDPIEPLSAAELGQALGGLSDETVRQRERAGELFSVLRPGRKRGREYPAFQAWPGIAGEPLTKVLVTLRPSSASAAYGFFTSPTDLLAGLTPIEATLGRLTSARALDADATDLLAAAQAVRIAAVMKAAEAYAASQAA
jgi:hypothetical protein